MLKDILMATGDVYFSAADRSMTMLMSHMDFDLGLAHSILLQPALVIPDIFMFISPHLRRHVLRNGELSIFEAAMREGFVIPAFRRQFSSFEGAAAALTSEGILGMLHPDEVAALAARYDAVASRIFADPLVWPDRLGESYGKILATCLAGNLESDSGAQRIWRDTEALRDDAVLLAQTSIDRNAAAGVRRGDLYNSAARVLGVRNGTEMFGSVEAILMRYEGLHPPGSLEYEAASIYFRWIDDLYRLNQAVRFRAEPSTLIRRPAELEMVELGLDAAIRLGYATGAGTVSPDSAPFDVTIRIPAAALIAKLSPTELLGARDLGLAWFVAINNYLKNPDPVRRTAAERAIEEYASRLRALKPKEQTQNLDIRARLVEGAGPSAAGLVYAAIDRMAELNLPEIAAPFLSVIGATAYVLYSYRHDRRYVEAEVRHGRYSNVTLSA